MRRLVKGRSKNNTPDKKKGRKRPGITKKLSPAGVAQYIGHWPVNKKVSGPIPAQNTCVGCRPGPRLGA